MRFRGFVYLSLLLAWLALASAFAGNEHEHLVYLPKYSDLVAGGFDPAKVEALRVGSGGTYRRILGSDRIVRLLRASSFRDRLAGLGNFPSEKALERLLAKYLEGQTLQQLAREVAQIEHCSDQTVLKSFFEFTALNRAQHGTRGYLTLGEIRVRLFQEVQGILPGAFENYLKTTPSHAWRRLELSVPSTFYDRETLGKLQRIANRRGAQLRFFMGVPRDGGPDARRERDFPKIRKSLEEGWGHGADIVGSIHEVNEVVPRGSAAEIAERVNLERLADLLGRNGALRIHAFEAAREGTFYSALWDFLEKNVNTGRIPREIRIGHINTLEPSDVERFKRLQRNSGHSLSLVFEANIESNLLVRPDGTRDEALRRLRSTIERLHESGFKVVLGADGYGILGTRSQFLNSVALLRTNGMKTSSISRIVQDSSLTGAEKRFVLDTLRLSVPKLSGRTLSHCGFSMLLKNKVGLLHAR